MESTVRLVSIAMAITQNRFIDDKTNNWWCHCCSSTSQIKSNTHSRWKCNSNKFIDRDYNFIAIALIVIILFVNYCTTTVAAGAAPKIGNGISKDSHQLSSTWIEFQKRSLNHRSIQYQAQDVGNIFSQLGLFVQSRQRNATELSRNIFFKYYDM